MPIHRGLGLVALVLGGSLALAAAEALPGLKSEYANEGERASFTGANQNARVTETTEEDHGGNGRSLKCTMVQKEPDTPNHGCHAEAHLARFPSGKLFGPGTGFRYVTRHWVKFDAHCEAATVGFWQLKNREGTDRWRYLVALWRSAGQDGDRILFQANPTGTSVHHYAQLSRDGVPKLVASRWHEVTVAGHFAPDAGWAEVSLDGHKVTWYADERCTQTIGTRIPGPFLADVAGAQWQLQIGGYGFFKEPATPEANVFIDDVKVESWGP